MLAMHNFSRYSNKAMFEAQGRLNLDHQPPATLCHSRRSDNKRTDNDKHTSENPSLSKPSSVQDLAGNRCTD